MSTKTLGQVARDAFDKYWPRLDALVFEEVAQAVLKAHAKDIQVALWDAVNEYVRTCGGDPSQHVYGNTGRQQAVARIERILRGASSQPQDDTDGLEVGKVYVCKKGVGT